MGGVDHAMLTGRGGSVVGGATDGEREPGATGAERRLLGAAGAGLLGMGLSLSTLTGCKGVLEGTDATRGPNGRGGGRLTLLSTLPNKS